MRSFLIGFCSPRTEGKDIGLHVLIGEIIQYFVARPLVKLADNLSALLFEPHPDRVTVVGDVLSDAPLGAVCFVEVPPIMPYIKDISRLIIYNWNRRYPFDKRLDISPAEMGFKLVEVTEFEGSSHEKITKEIYER